MGYVDLMIRRGPSGPDLAIEIDSADKQWSVAKLRHAAAAGMIAIWVRWGDESWAGVYDDIDVIQLQVTRRSAPRSSVETQLTLWSDGSNVARSAVPTGPGRKLVPPRATLANYAVQRSRAVATALRATA